MPYWTILRGGIEISVLIGTFVQNVRGTPISIYLKSIEYDLR